MSKLRQLIEAANRKCEMAWKVYSYNPEKDNELVDTSKAFDCIAAAQAHKRDILEKNPNYTVEIIAESSQKNETGWRKDTYSSNLLLNDGDYVAEVITSIIKNNIKVEIRKDYKVLAQKGSFSDKEQAKDWAEKALDKVKKGQKPEAANIDVKNPGVLEVPNGKKVDELPQSHFEKLVDKKGYAEVIRALTNLEVWNKDKNKSLSSWASNMADKLKKKFRPESTQKNEATFKPGDKVSVKSYYKDGNQFITLRNATIIKEITEKEAGQLDPAYNWKEPTGMKYYLVKLNTGSKKAVLASDLVLESAQKDLANHLLQVLSKGGATLRQLQDFESKGYSNKDLSDTLKDLIQQKKIKTSFEGGTTRYTLTESAQKNESLRDLNLELADDTNAIAASADKIRQRFEYRTLQNQSYDEKQAEKIYLEVRRELEKAKKMIDACYNKIG